MNCSHLIWDGVDAILTHNVAKILEMCRKEVAILGAYTQSGLSQSVENLLQVFEMLFHAAANNDDVS